MEKETEKMILDIEAMDVSDIDLSSDLALARPTPYDDSVMEV